MSTWWKDSSEMDPAQIEIISLPLDESFVVSGPPGGGKTNLLLLRAKFLHASGKKNIAIITFARSLKEFIESGSDQYAFSHNNIITYSSWAKSILAENGIAFPDRGTFEEIRQSLLDGLNAVAASSGAEKTYEHIFLDEVQDFTAEELSTISSFSPHIFAVGDARQRILSEDESAFEKLGQLGVQEKSLRHHYRNGRQICRVADAIVGHLDDARGLEATSQYDEVSNPSRVQYMTDMSLEEQLTEVVTRIETQVQAYPNEYIGILSPKVEDLNAAGEFLRASRIGHLLHVQHGEYTAVDISRPVILTTIHGAKGLEFRAVHLIAAEMLKRFKLQRKLAYTAVTRCKTSLSIYSNGAIPGYLAAGEEANNPTKSLPSIDDLFKVI